MFTALARKDVSSLSTLLHNKLLRIVFAASIAALLLFGFTTVLTPSQSAHAATNGQQIKFTCSSPMGTVIIKGPNQDGNEATWQGEGRPDDVYVSQVFTKDWWWKGDVTITYYSKNVSQWYSQTNYVPPGGYWPGDKYVNLGCNN